MGLGRGRAAAGGRGARGAREGVPRGGAVAAMAARAGRARGAGGGRGGGLAGPAVLAVGLMAVSLGAAEPALAAASGNTASLHAVAAASPSSAREVALLASQDPPFWENMIRYSRYMVTLLAGTGYVILKPLGRFLRSPTTAVPFILGTGLAVYLIKFTLEAMLGLSDDPLGGPVGGGLSAY